MKPINYHIELSSDPEFKETVTRLVKERQLEEIIETGTFMGTGSTLVFAQTGLPVFSLECNPRHVQIARKNLVDYPNVNIINGLSLKKQEMMEFIHNDPIYDQKLEIEVEGGNMPRFFYFHEINHNVPEDLLTGLVNNPKRQLILLDSAGGVGFLEFQKVMALKLTNKALFLDDTQHVKHYRSVQALEQSGLPIHRSASGRWVWVDLK